MRAYEISFAFYSKSDSDINIIKKAVALMLTMNDDTLFENVNVWELSDDDEYDDGIDYDQYQDQLKDLE